jgi:muramoyltetrapeptide carboxypeptidase
MLIQPAPLRPGDRVGIMCPAGFMPIERTEACVQALQSWGYEVVIGQTLRTPSTNYFSGTDEERARDLQQMLDDDSIRAILFGRGGYGMIRILDQLDFTRFLQHPKWIAGYSDITVILAHLYTKYQIASMHSPMAGAFAEPTPDARYLSSILHIFSGMPMNYEVDANLGNRLGTATGPLMGGNLALFTHLIGTASFPNTQGAILFLEDVGEQLYNIDRMLRQLKRGGHLENLAGLIFGGFTECKDTERPFGQELLEILQAIVSEYDFPVCYDFPVSHTPRNYALKYGVKARLDVQSTQVILREISD